MEEIRLNKAQQKAVNHTEGPLMIIAGAGTGKTKVISEKICHLTQVKHIEPKKILAVTFTEKGAGEMESRVSEFISPHIEPVYISTFHGFCHRVMQQDGLHIGIPSDFQIMTKAEQLVMLYDNFSKLNLKYYKPVANPTSCLNDLLSLFSNLKTQNITEDCYFNLVSQYEDKITQTTDLNTKKELQETHERLQEEANTYKTYNKLLRENNMLDYGDIIQLTYQLFRSKKNILKKYQDKFKYVLVDEYQDTNIVQNDIIKLLVEKHKNICVVGDDDQSIFKFQGASLDNILNFEAYYPNTTQIVLNENYRSGQNILDASYELIQHNNPDRLEESLKISKHLKSNVKSVGSIRKVECLSWEYELSYILETIKKKINDGKQYKDIAILYRSHSTGNNIIPILKNAKIPYIVLEGPGLYQTEEIQTLRNILKFIVDPNDSMSLFDILKLNYFSIDPLLVIRLSNFADKNGISLYTSVLNYHKDIQSEKPQDINMTLFSAGLENSEEENIKNIIKKLKDLISLQIDNTTVQIIYKLLYEDYGYLNQLEEKYKDNPLSKDQKIANLSKFYRRAERFEYSTVDRSLKNFNRMLDIFIEAGEDPDQQEISSDYNAVSLLTVHKAKGLEFDTVIISGLAQRKFPSDNRRNRIATPEELLNSAPPSSESHRQEERRLMYTAMTRAKQDLHLIYSKKNVGSMREVKASIFFDEVPDELSENIIYERANIEDIHKIYTMQSLEQDIQVKDNLRIDSLGTLISLSYSNIISYKTCPLKFKYQKIYRIPSEPKPPLKFGQYIHRVLEYLHKSINQGVIQTEDQLIDYYHKNWHMRNAGFDNHEHADQYKAEGERILRDYYNKNKDDFKKSLYLEKRFVFFSDQFRVNGVIDRIDPGPDDTCEVIDYKTGKPKTLTDLKRNKDQLLQMYIYAIACQDQLNMNATKLTFYYLTDGSKVTIEATPENMADADTIIRETAEKIKTGDFTPDPADFKCKYCEYNKICPARYKRL